MNSQKIVNLLTICRRAGRLVTGFDVSIDAVRSKEAKYILTASNVSVKTLKELNYLLNKENFSNKVKVLSMPLTIDDVYRCINVNAGIIAICDDGFGKSFERLTTES